MFYERFEKLCQEHGYTPSGAVLAIGRSKNLAAKWKNTGAKPSAEVLNQLSEFFDVSVDYLLGKAEKPTENDELSDQQKELIAFARSVPDDKAALVLKLLRAILEDPQ